MKRIITISLLTALLLAACGSAGGQLAIQDAWARPSAAGNNGAVYLQISNGPDEDTLTGASADLARAVEIHESRMVEAEEDADHGHDHSEGDHEHEGDSHADTAEGGMEDMATMQMRPVESLSLAAGEAVLFEPGGFHVMLIDLQQDLVEGQTFTITLHFAEAGDVEVEVVVEQR